MERPFVEIERHAAQIRAEFIRELAGQFGSFVKRGIHRFGSFLSQADRAEAK